MSGGGPRHFFPGGLPPVEHPENGIMPKRKRKADGDLAEAPAKRPVSELTAFAVSKMLEAQSPMLAAHVLEKKLDGSKVQALVASDQGRLKEVVKQAYLSAAAKKVVAQKAQATAKKAVLSSAEAAAEKEILYLKNLVADNASTPPPASKGSKAKSNLVAILSIIAATLSLILCRYVPPPFGLKELCLQGHCVVLPPTARRTRLSRRRYTL